MSTGEPALSCECTPVVDARYEERSDRSPAEAVVDALAEAEGVDPVDFPRLYDSVDPDVINSLFDRHYGIRGTALFSFRIDTWNVFVRTDGRIRVCDGTRSGEPTPVFGSGPA